MKQMLNKKTVRIARPRTASGEGEKEVVAQCDGYQLVRTLVRSRRYRQGV